MRNNQPITQQEYPLREGDFLISRTDLKGRITYANPAFIEASGFREEELLGAPHNLVRHPDMPTEVYANFWQTLQAGKSWNGIIKNRRKDGDHYWADAKVTPLVEDGEVVGYASVRVRAEKAEIERAEQAYRDMREGRGKRLRLNRGQLERRGALGTLKRINLSSVKAKLASMVGVAMLLLLSSGALGIYALQASGERLQRLNQDGLEDVVRLQQIGQLLREAPQRIASQERMTIMNSRESHVEELQQAIARLEVLWGEFMAREVNHSGASHALGEALNAYMHEQLQDMAQALQGEPFEAFQALNENLEGLLASSDQLTGAVNELIERERVVAQGMAIEAEAGQQQMLWALLGMLALGLALLVVIGGMTIRALSKPLNESLGFALQIASGNLAAEMPEPRKDEMGKLMAALDVMRKSLTSIVGDVNRGASIVTPAARDIARGNEDLAARTEQQAASLQETASSMEEMTATVRQNSDNARQGSVLAVENSEGVQQTGALMNQVVDSMALITRSSRQMIEIIDVIDSIAFQTNILALNASVEAARAGEQGRGFAVVADEVRSLAGRSAEAAKEIRQLIDGSAKQIDNGADLVRQAEDAIEEVVTRAKRVNDIMGEIAAASDEQSRGITQINQAIAQMDEVTQQNASRVQDSARAAVEMESQTLALANAVAAFRLRGSGMESVAAAKARAAGTQGLVEIGRIEAPRHRRREGANESADASPSTALARHDARTAEWETF